MPALLDERPITALTPAADAHKRLEEKGQFGKIVLMM